MFYLALIGWKLVRERERERERACLFFSVRRVVRW